MTKLTRISISRVIESLLENTDLRKVTVYQHPELVVKATRQHRFHARERQRTVLLTYGKPNYEERAFVAACKIAGEPFPVRKPQLKYWPTKRK